MPTTVEQIELAACGPGQVRVKLAAVGVCHSDLSVREGTIPFIFPTVLGHEGAGVVAEVGDLVTRVKPGDRVVLTWMAPCRTCYWCLRGQAFLCARNVAESLESPYAHLGDQMLVRGLGCGAFAEETLVAEDSVVVVDAPVPLEAAALVGCAVATGVGAVWQTARVEPGSNVAVVGCGGVGLSVVAGARLAGAAAVIAVDRVPSRLEAARHHGSDKLVDASRVDPVATVREMTDGRGADYVFEVVGRSGTIRQSFDMTRRGGTVVIVGAGSPTDEVRFSAMDMFVDAKRILGCVYGSVDPQRDFPVLLELAGNGSLDVGAMVSRTISLDGIDEAYDALASADGVRSVVVFGEGLSL